MEHLDDLVSMHVPSAHLNGLSEGQPFLFGQLAASFSTVPSGQRTSSFSNTYELFKQVFGSETHFPNLHLKIINI